MYGISIFYFTFYLFGGGVRTHPTHPLPTGLQCMGTDVERSGWAAGCWRRAVRRRSWRSAAGRRPRARLRCSPSGRPTRPGDSSPSPATSCTPTHARTNNKLSYRRGTARCVVSVEILPTATQQRRNCLYDKSWTKYQLSLWPVRQNRAVDSAWRSVR